MEKWRVAGHCGGKLWYRRGVFYVWGWIVRIPISGVRWVAYAGSYYIFCIDTHTHLDQQLCSCIKQVHYTTQKSYSYTANVVTYYLLFHVYYLLALIISIPKNRKFLSLSLSLSLSLCYRLLHNLNWFKTIGATSAILQLVVGPKALGYRNHIILTWNLLHPT